VLAEVRKAMEGVAVCVRLALAQRPNESGGAQAERPLAQRG
jgi:hypothetical protein